MADAQNADAGGKSGQEIVEIARTRIGDDYVLGAKAPYDNPDYSGPWDCAEFATWAVYQGTGIILGCRPLQPSNSEAFTGFWYEDALRFGLVVSKQAALAEPGALLCRRASSGLIGHIAISIGNGADVVEAASSNLGVVERSALGRPWDIGIRVPTKDDISGDGHTGDGAGGAPLFRASSTPVFDQRVQAIQSALKSAGFDPGVVDGLFGDWTEKAVINFQASRGLVADGIVGRETGRALGLPFWDAGGGQVIGAGNGQTAGKDGADGVHPGYGVRFESLFAGGFFSSDPDDVSVKRSIRTNNPGALNITGWQQAFPGYVGKTFPDSQGNQTTIYQTPEHGTAAWYHLLTKRYNYGLEGDLRIGALAARYAGVSSENDSRAKVYINGWKAHSGGALERDTVIRLNKMDEVLALAKAMFAFEIGAKSPLIDGQIVFAVEKWRAGELS